MSNAESKWLGIRWQIAPTSGWGVLGFNLALEAELEGRYLPVPLCRPIHPESFPEKYKDTVQKLCQRAEAFQDLLNQHKDEYCHCDFPFIHSLGNRLLRSNDSDKILSSQNLAIIFFEDTYLGLEAIERARPFSLILAGSSWNNEVLQKNGIRNTQTFLQGIDPTLFHFNRPESKPKARFLVFSGGKLEYRKGQDIVVAAFKKFQERHSDAVLVTAWHNHWPQTMRGIVNAGYVSGVPQLLGDGRLDFSSWLQANGIPKAATHDIGLVANLAMPSLYSQVDAAIFPNRCEGGTNLVAMECMACGVPTVLSANTGHLDLIDERHCYPLTQQGTVAPVPPVIGTEGWGESDVDEVVEVLERIYRDRDEAAKRGAAAARFMESWTWRNRYLALVELLERIKP